MPTYHTFLTPSLTPNAVLDISLPTHWNPSSSGAGSGKSVADKSIVRQFELGEWKEEAPLGLIRKLTVRDGVVALADSTNRITLAQLPKPPKAPSPSSDKAEDETKPSVPETEDDEDEEDEDLVIVDQFKVKGKKKGDSWVGLDMVDSGVLSTTSSGILTLNQQSSSSSSSTRTAKLPSGLKVAQSLGSSGEKIIVAGKEVDVSIYDTERVFAAGPDDPNGSGGKRKKGEMEVGEIWRAKGLPNNHLNLRVPIHHLCMTLLPTSSTESDSTSNSIVTGTKSGHVRRYDTRQRKPVDGWKVAREGGIGAVSAGQNEHELFFADTSSFLGSMDLRTGKLLYAYAAQTSTPHVLFPLPNNPTSTSTSSSSASAFNSTKAKSEKNRIGLVTLSSDYTLRACSTTAPPADKRRNVGKGEVLGMIGGVGSGSVGWYGILERDEGEDDEEEGVEGEEYGAGSDEDEEVWDDMSVVRDDGEEDEDEDEDVDESEVESETEGGVKGGKRTKRG